MNRLITTQTLTDDLDALCLVLKVFIVRLLAGEAAERSDRRRPGTSVLFQLRTRSDADLVASVQRETTHLQADEPHKKRLILGSWETNRHRRI